MSYANDKRFIGVIIVLLPLIIAFALAYYNSATSVVKPYEVFRKKFYNNNPLHNALSRSPAEQPVPTDQLNLKKDEKYFIGKTCMVYKGISRGAIGLDVVILELDPDVSYPLRLTKESMNDGIWIGDSLYRLISVNRDTLQLEIQNAY